MFQMKTIVAGVGALAVMLVFPLTAELRPAQEASTAQLDSSPVYQFGGGGLFTSEAKLTRITEEAVRVAAQTNQLPETAVDAWMNESQSGTISPVDAHAQTKRISDVRKIPLREVKRMISELTESHALGGDTIDLAKLNVALNSFSSTGI